MSRVYINGFETGDFSECKGSSGGATSVQGLATAGFVRSGAYVMGVGAAATGYRESGLDLSLSTCYARVAVYIDGSLPFTNAFHGLLGASDATDSFNIFVLWVNTNGTIETINDASGVNVSLGTGTIPLVGNAWNIVEVKCIVDATNGFVQVKINGVVDQTYTGLTNNQKGNIAGTSWGALAAAPGHDLWFDDIAIDDGVYCDVSKIITRQGKSGTPTSNGWTKVGGATIDAVWSDTPVNATINANSGSTTSAIAQTMLVASVSGSRTTTGGGYYGVETAISTDVVNGVKVGAVAKIDVNTAASGAIRRIFSGNTTDYTSLSLTTVDTYYETTVFNETIDTINAAEIGFNKLSTGVARTVTVEDMWIMVDYTPTPLTLMGQICM